MSEISSQENRGFEPRPSVGGWVVDDPMFRFLVDYEIQKAQRLRYSVSLVCLAADVRLDEARQMTRFSLADVLIRDLRATDVVTPRTRDSLALLLVDAEIPHLTSILRRLITGLEVRAWSAGGTSYPRTSARSEDLLRDAAELMAKARAEGGNRLYVPS